MTQLFAKAAAKKIQVKLLKNVQGTGQKGEVVNVTPAFFNNKLRPMQAADKISDSEVAVENAEKKQLFDETRAEATDLADELAAKTIVIKRKAGEDGTLFGGIGQKVIAEELQAVFKEHSEFLSRKGVKIVSVTEDGKKLKHDIKHIGDFEAQISLTKDIAAKVKVEVQAEE